MKLGIIADAHGNPRALELCLRVLERLEADKIYFLGDAVGYLPGANEVLNILRVTPVQCQKGNHEAMLLGELPLPDEKDRVYRIESARERISQANLEFVQNWPKSREVCVNGRKIFLVHGSLKDYLEGYVYPEGDFNFVNNCSYDAIFVGHTHYPFVFDRQGTQVVNVGSCGLPRDQGNLSSFATYDACAHHTEILRVPFDSRKIIGSFQRILIAQEVIDCFNRRSAKPFGLRVNVDIL
ncbi:MAG: metallophosphoesterase family protein [Candidatus Hodarchaeota archaeon]